MSERPRDIVLERYLTGMAARAVSLPGTAGLDNFADARARLGGVRRDLDPDRETAEELADARNYLVWGIEPHWQAHQAGDPDASDVIERRLRALGGVVLSWDHLHRTSS